MLRNFFLCLLLLLTFQAHAAEKVALVIGNSEYRHAVALPNPRNDAEDVAALLESLDFNVIKGSDLDRLQMEGAIREFAVASADAKTVLFFYAGHGMQVAGRNYLIPIDAELAERSALDFEAIDVDKVFQYMTGGDKVALAFLDACRNNPLSRNFARKLGPTRSVAVGDGLAPTNTAGSGLFIAYATAPNDVALDGDDRNSPFTAALLHYLPSPDVEIQQVMTRVKADVQRRTNGAQRPWHNSDLTTEVYLARHKPVPDSIADETDLANSADEKFWNAVKDTKDAALLRVFIDRFPKSPRVPFAEFTIASLGDEANPQSPKDPSVIEAVRKCELLSEALLYKIVDVGNRRVRPDEILDTCQKAASAAPKNAVVAYRLALAYNNLDDYQAYGAALHTAVELGSADAKYVLAESYSSTIGDLSYDPELGLKMLTEVAEDVSDKNQENALWAAGNLRYLDTQNQRYWSELYIARLKSASDAGLSSAEYFLARYYADGSNVRIPKDVTRASDLYKSAISHGDLWSHFYIAKLYKEGEPAIAKDMQKVAEHVRTFEQGMTALYERGNIQALISIASLYRPDGLKPNLEKSIEIYKAAAAEGVVTAYFYLSLVYGSKENRGVYDPAEAERWELKNAAAIGDCGSSPYNIVKRLHPEIDMLSTPEKAARCYLDALKKHKPYLSNFRIGRSPGIFAKEHRPIPQSTKMAIQRMLKEEGYYSGRIDGDFGDGTYASLQAYMGK